MSCVLCGEFIGIFILGIRFNMLSEYILTILLGFGGFYAVHGLLRTERFDS